MALNLKIIHFAVTLSVVTFCYTLELSDNCRNFSLQVINITDLSRDRRSVVLAPFSLWNLLFTVAFAASGDSAKQVRAALKLSGENNENVLIEANNDLTKQVLKSDNPGVRLTSGNYMFWDDEFQINTEFKEVMSNGLGIENKILNFSDSIPAAAMANAFIPNSKLKFGNILHHKDFNTSRMILTSLMSFEGLWTMPFDSSDTTIEPFYSEKGEIIRDVYMMKQRNKFSFTNIRELGAFVLQMSYGSSDEYCMLILLPSPGKTISEVYKNLIHNYTVVNIFHKLNDDTKNYGLEDIDIKIPRFEIITNRESNKFLRVVGVNDIFFLKTTNFSRATNEEIFVSKIKQRIHINVNESGTSAADSTTASFADRHVPMSTPSGTTAYRPTKLFPVYSPGFIANRPFIYYVIEKKTTTVVFGGAFSELTVF